MSGFRLSTRITIAAIALVAVGAMALMFLEDARLRDVYLGEQRAKLEQSLHAEKLRLSHAISTLRQDVLFLSNTPPVSGIVRAALNRGHDARDGDTREKWEARLQQVFSAFSAARPDYYQIRFIGVTDGGRELVRIDNRGGEIEVTPPSRLQAKGDRDYFKATLGLRAGEVSLSELNLNQELGVIEQPHRLTLRASTLVFTPSGQIFGMVVVNTDAKHLLESARQGLPAGVQAYIANMDGGYLLHPDASRSFGFELGRKDNIVTDFPLLKTMFNPLASGHLPLQSVAANAGARYLAAERIHFDPGNPARFLLLAYHLPDTVAAQQIATIPGKHIVGGFTAMLLVSGIALLALRRAFAPLEQITAAASKIAAGNHDVQLPQNSSGEIGSLANAFSIMLSKLSQREHDIRLVNTWLEERVKERTAELELARQEASMQLRRNQVLMLTSMDGIHVMDMQGNLLVANDAFCRMLGYSQEEIATLNVAAWDAQWTAEELQAQFRELVGKSAMFETLYRRKDGTLINAEISASGVELEGQRLIFASSRDITGRKQVEAQSAKSLSLLLATLESTNDAILVVDLDNTWVLCNQQFADLWHIPDEIVASGDDGAALSYVLDQLEDADGFLHKVRELYATPEASSFDILEFKDGKIVERYSIPQRIGNKVAGRVWSFRDITVRKRGEEELRIAAAAFETQDAIMITDTGGNIVRVNRAFSTITGYSPEDVIGKNMTVMSSGQDGQNSCIEMLQQSIHDGSWAGEIFDKRKNGQIYPKWMTVTAVKNERQETSHYVSIFSDITARKQVEDAKLRESDERFRGTLEQVAVGIAHASLDGHFQHVNQKFCDIVGYTRDELLQMSFHDITFHDDLGKNIHYIRQLLAGEISTFSMEKRYVRKDRDLVWANLTVSILRNADGTPQCTIGVIEDITERRHAEVLVQQFGSLLQGSFNEIYLFDAQSLHFLLTSEGAEKNLGYSDDELNQLTFLDVEPLFTQESFKRMVAPLRSGEQPLLFFEAVHRRKDGTTYPVEARLQFMRGETPVFLAIIQDITGRKQAERDLMESHEQLRGLSAHLQAVREEERVTIAREVHDELGQTLTALRMKIAMLRMQHGANDPVLTDQVSGMVQLVDRAIQGVRHVAASLRPAALDMGIVPALKWLSNDFAAHSGIPCALHGADIEVELDELRAVAVFRVVQEALTNVARHAKAGQVGIELRQMDWGVKVVIRDDGRGFYPSELAHKKTFGLLGMRERAIALGGEVEINSTPGHGTEISILIPPQQTGEVKAQ